MSQTNKHDMLYTDIIIPFRASSKDRYENLMSVIMYLKNAFVNFRIILSADGLFYPSFIDSKIILIYEETTKPFNKPKLCNRGFRVSTSSVVCFYDADTIVRPDVLCYCVGDLLENDNSHVLNPYQYVDNITGAKRTCFSESHRYETIISDEHKECVSRMYEQNNSGVTLFKSSSFRTLGGYNEMFSGWGCEDDELLLRARRIKMQWNSIPGVTLYHLHHDSIAMDMERTNKDNYKKNAEYLSTITNYDDNEFEEYITTLKTNVF